MDLYIYFYSSVLCIILDIRLLINWSFTNKFISTYWFGMTHSGVRSDPVFSTKPARRIF